MADEVVTDEMAQMLKEAGLDVSEVAKVAELAAAAVTSPAAAQRSPSSRRASPSPAAAAAGATGEGRESGVGGRSDDAPLTPTEALAVNGLRAGGWSADGSRESKGSGGRSPSSRRRRGHDSGGRSERVAATPRGVTSGSSSAGGLPTTTPMRSASGVPIGSDARDFLAYDVLQEQLQGAWGKETRAREDADRARRERRQARLDAQRAVESQAEEVKRLNEERLRDSQEIQRLKRELAEAVFLKEQGDRELRRLEREVRRRDSVGGGGASSDRGAGLASMLGGRVPGASAGSDASGEGRGGGSGADLAADDITDEATVRRLVQLETENGWLRRELDQLRSEAVSLRAKLSKSSKIGDVLHMKVTTLQEARKELTEEIATLRSKLARRRADAEDARVARDKVAALQRQLERERLRIATLRLENQQLLRTPSPRKATQRHLRRSGASRSRSRSRSYSPRGVSVSPVPSGAATSSAQVRGDNHDGADRPPSPAARGMEAAVAQDAFSSTAADGSPSSQRVVQSAQRRRARHTGGFYGGVYADHPEHVQRSRTNEADGRKSPSGVVAADTLNGLASTPLDAHLDSSRDDAGSAQGGDSTEPRKHRRHRHRSSEERRRHHSHRHRHRAARSSHNRMRHDEEQGRPVRSPTRRRRRSTAPPSGGRLAANDSAGGSPRARTQPRSTSRKSARPESAPPERPSPRVGRGAVSGLSPGRAGRIVPRRRSVSPGMPDTVEEVSASRAGELWRSALRSSPEKVAKRWAYSFN